MHILEVQFAAICSGLMFISVVIIVRSPYNRTIKQIVMMNEHASLETIDIFRSVRNLFDTFNNQRFSRLYHDLNLQMPGRCCPPLKRSQVLQLSRRSCTPYSGNCPRERKVLAVLLPSASPNETHYWARDQKSAVFWRGSKNLASFLKRDLSRTRQTCVPIWSVDTMSKIIIMFQFLHLFLFSFPKIYTQCPPRIIIKHIDKRSK